MITDPFFYLVAVPAVLLLGISKSGFGAGFGSLAVPMMALAVTVPEAALTRVYDGANGQANPFLHLSMHLSISEQCSIDQPRGIRQAVELLAARRDSLHEAHHDAMDCLGQMLWESQRAGRPPDGQAYIDCVQRKATQD